MRLRSVVFWVVVLAALLPGLLLTFTRAVEPEGGRWIRLESFTPYGVPLYLLALLLLAVAAFRGRRPWTIALAGVAAAGLALHCWWWSPMVTGANPPAPEGAERLRVMTANVYLGQADGPALVEDIADAEIDLLVVPEITEDLLADMERAGLDEVLPYRAGDAEGTGSATMMFATQPLDDPTPLDTRWGGWQVTMGDLTVLGVHPSSPVDPGWWRRDHAEILAAARASDADLIVGDLNATIDHEPMRRLADAGFRSVTELANEGWQPTWPAYGVIDVAGLELPRVVQIDHVLVGPRLAAVGSHTLAIPGTDHRALVAEVALR